MTRSNPVDYHAAATRVRSWKRPLLFSHTKPDGDALGSLAAMRSLLRPLGVEPVALIYEPLSERYAFCERFGAMTVWDTNQGRAAVASCDGVIVLDTCAYTQLTPIADWLRATDVDVLAVDHHITRDDLATTYLIDETAAANCLILFEWAKTVGWSIDAEAAIAMFMGIAMDTGWFHHSNTDQRALTAAGELVALGASPHALYQTMFQRESAARLRLQGAALTGMELLCSDRLAVSTLTASDFDNAGATLADTEDIINEPLRIASVAVSVLLVEQDADLVRASFRSKPPSNSTEPDVDVAAIAQHFGGGGHRRAAGARIPGSLLDVRSRVIARVEL